MSSMKTMYSGAAPLAAALVKQVRSFSPRDENSHSTPNRCRVVWIPNEGLKTITKSLLRRVRRHCLNQTYQLKLPPKATDLLKRPPQPTSSP